VRMVTSSRERRMWWNADEGYSQVMSRRGYQRINVNNHRARVQ
jgi:hypothetical protein